MSPRLLPLLALALAGCSGAPTITIAGSLVPAWLACAVLGVGAAVVARLVFVATGLARVLPLQLAVCSSLGFIVAALVWAAWVGR